MRHPSSFVQRSSCFQWADEARLEELVTVMINIHVDMKYEGHFELQGANEDGDRAFMMLCRGCYHLRVLAATLSDWKCELRCAVLLL